MRILTFSDLRCQPIELIADIISEYMPDVVMYAGDDLIRIIPFVYDHIIVKYDDLTIKLNYPNFDPIDISEREIIIEEEIKQKINDTLHNLEKNREDFIKTLKAPFHYVNGNDDEILMLDNNNYLCFEEMQLKYTRRKNKIYLNLDKQDFWQINYVHSKESAKFYIPITPSFEHNLIRVQNEAVSFFGIKCSYGIRSRILNTPENYADIYLSHLPPFGILDLGVRFGIKHLGSMELLKSIKKYKPKIIICGHSHFWGGYSHRIDNTVIINVSSPDNTLFPINYALIDTQDWSINIEKREYKTLSKIRGFKSLKKEIWKKILNKKNRNKIDLLFKFRKKVNELESDYKINKRELYSFFENLKTVGINTELIERRVESINWEKPKIIKEISIDPEESAFVDVETGLAYGESPGPLWLIGIYFKGNFEQFLYPEQYSEFVNYLKINEIKKLVSWTNYDSKLLKPLLKESKLDIKFIDACQRTANCVIWHSYALDDIYKVLCGEGKHLESPITGKIAGIYADHIILSRKSCKHCPPKELIQAQIKQKNKDDIFKMVEICKRLYKKI